MKTNYANAGMLDMIFEHRNKAYGAYVLRRDYNQSLKKALAIALSAVFLLLFGNFLREKLHGNAVLSSKKVIEVETKDLGQMVKPVDPPKPPVQPEKNDTKPKATVTNTEKTVVAENQPHTDSVATNEDPTRAESGLHTTLDGATDGSGV